MLKVNWRKQGLAAEQIEKVSNEGNLVNKEMRTTA